MGNLSTESSVSLIKLRRDGGALVRKVNFLLHARVLMKIESLFKFDHGHYFVLLFARNSHNIVGPNTMNPIDGSKLAAHQSAFHLLPAVPHVVFGIFNIAIPNIIAWSIVVVVLLIGAWMRLPKVFESRS
ncbi:MAG: hypothetical protein M1470_12815 [Bacteroidetes bacterium]|nr:hypothetical protein [Bacteroidota bacterium]MCL5738729.1 hypothetical protein [Bacteroidota bacterium]